MQTTTARPPVAALAGLLLLALTTLLAACGGDSASADDPPDIELGKTECDRCHMIISDERFAAGLVDEDGTSRVFDDIGELVVTVQEEGIGEQRAWVHDYNSKAWIDATTATFAVGMDVVTPMGTGVSAFATNDAATAFAASSGGKVMTWDQMVGEWKMEKMQH